MTDLLLAPDWWRTMVSSVARQILQTVVPILATVEAAEGRISVSTTALALTGAVIVTGIHGVLRALAGLGPAGPAARFVATAAGVALGLMPVSLAGMVDLGPDGWRALLLASLAGGLVSLAGFWADPPKPAGYGVS